MAPSIEVQSLNHWTIREVPFLIKRPNICPLEAHNQGQCLSNTSLCILETIRGKPWWGVVRARPEDRWGRPLQKTTSEGSSEVGCLGFMERL